MGKRHQLQAPDQNLDSPSPHGALRILHLNIGATCPDWGTNKERCPSSIHPASERGSQPELKPSADAGQRS